MTDIEPELTFVGHDLNGPNPSAPSPLNPELGRFSPGTCLGPAGHYHSCDFRRYRMHCPNRSGELLRAFNHMGTRYMHGDAEGEDVQWYSRRYKKRLRPYKYAAPGREA